MSVPDFQTLMLPVLKQLASSGEQPPAAVREAVATVFHLSPVALAELLPSGRQTTFANRVAWALGYLKQAGRYVAYARYLFFPNQPFYEASEIYLLNVGQIQ